MGQAKHFLLQQGPSRVIPECAIVKNRGRENGQDCSEKFVGVSCMLLTVEVHNNCGIFELHMFRFRVLQYNSLLVALYVF